MGAIALLSGRCFNGLAATGVKLKQMVDLVLGFGGCGQPETGGGGGRGAAYVGLAGDELEQIEGDVFTTARYGERSGFHGSMVASGAGARKRGPRRPGKELWVSCGSPVGRFRKRAEPLPQYPK